MKRTVPTITLLLLTASLAAAQDDHSHAVVDTTIVTEEGTTLRFKGVLPTVDKPGSPERVEAMTTDDRVPVGYGFRTLRLWKEGDPRQAPVVEETRIVTEFLDFDYAGPYVPENTALSMAEYADYAYFALKDRLGWELPGGERMKLSISLDLKRYGREHGLPWWVPGDVRDGVILIQPISVITSRGIAMEAMIHYYLEWQLRKRTGDRIPYWFHYGVGAYFGAEGWVLKDQAEVLKGTYDVEIDHDTMVRDLELFRDRELMMKEVDTPGILEDERCRSRLAYWRAFRLLENIMSGEGLKPFGAMVADMESDADLSFEDAVARHYGKSLETLLNEHKPW